MKIAATAYSTKHLLLAATLGLAFTAPAYAQRVTTAPTRNPTPIIVAPTPVYTAPAPAPTVITQPTATPSTTTTPNVPAPKPTATTDGCGATAIPKGYVPYNSIMISGGGKTIPLYLVKPAPPPPAPSLIKAPCLKSQTMSLSSMLEKGAELAAAPFREVFGIRNAEAQQLLTTSFAFSVAWTLQKRIASGIQQEGGSCKSKYDRVDISGTYLYDTATAQWFANPVINSVQGYSVIDLTSPFGAGDPVWACQRGVGQKPGTCNQGPYDAGTGAGC